MLKRIRIGFYLTAAIFLVITFTGCEKAKPLTPQNEVIPVKVLKVKLQDIKRTLDYVGNVTAREEALIYPKVSGKIIEKVKEDGSSANKGDVVAYIDRDEVGLKFEKAPVESPLTGIIGRFLVDVGTNVTPQTPIALVVDMEKVEIKLDIPEKYVAQIALGQNASIYVDTYPGQEFIGKITKISPVLDPDTRAAPIEISIDNADHRLKSGMLAKVKLVLEEHKDVPVVLKEAIIGTGPDFYVYSVENKKAVLKKITLGIHQSPYFEVLAGLQENDSVVIMGQQRLRDGSAVEPEE